MRTGRVARGTVSYGAPRVRESDIAEAIRQTVKAAGYVHESTQEHRRKVRCPNLECQRWFTPGGGSGVTKGIGDGLVTHPAWCGLKLNLEYKGPKGTLTKEQRESVERGTLIAIDPKGNYKRQALHEILQVERARFADTVGHAARVDRLLEKMREVS